MAGATWRPLQAGRIEFSPWLMLLLAACRECRRPQAVVSAAAAATERPSEVSSRAVERLSSGAAEFESEPGLGFESGAVAGASSPLCVVAN